MAWCCPLWCFCRFGSDDLWFFGLLAFFDFLIPTLANNVVLIEWFITILGFIHKEEALHPVLIFLLLVACDKWFNQTNFPKLRMIPYFLFIKFISEIRYLRILAFCKHKKYFGKNLCLQIFFFQFFWLFQCFFHLFYANTKILLLRLGFISLYGIIA